MIIKIIEFRKLFLENIPTHWKAVVEKKFDKTLKEIKEINGSDDTGGRGKNFGTEKCIICGNIATIYYGHLHFRGENVF